MGESTIRGFDSFYGGISIPTNKTLTINGPGSLLAGTSVDDFNGSGAGTLGGFLLWICGLSATNTR